MKYYFCIILFLTCFSSYAETLRIATSTSTTNSGLLPYLVPFFEEKSGIQVEYTAVGSGAALNLARQGKVDLVLVNSPSAELRFMEQGYGLTRTFVMFNDFLFVGPANKKNSKSLPSLLTSINTDNRLFVSRGDNSGTHKKELSLWKSQNIEPVGKAWYRELGLGMGETLVNANTMGAITLVDRGTWLAKESQLKLTVLFDNAAQLQNSYCTIIVNPKKLKNKMVNVNAAKQFVDFITSRSGQELIANHTVNGKLLFKPIDMFTQ